MSKEQELKIAQEDLDMEITEIQAMTNGRLLENLLALSYDIQDSERMANFEYANKRKPRYHLLYREVERRMSEYLTLRRLS